jgi:hypothetical protein
MPERSLPLLPALLTLHGAPLLALSVIVFAAWVTGDLGDGPSAFAILITAAISLLFVVHRLLPLAPGF